MDICCFWHSGSLRDVDRLCLSSMVHVGHFVKLFTYGAIDNVPSGVHLRDAESILAHSFLYRLDPDYPDFRPGLSIVQFSDFFRIMLMKYEEGAWLDTDVYLVKPFCPIAGQTWLARENRSRVGVSALYLPSDNPIISAFESYMNGTDFVPEWLGFKRKRIRPLYLSINRIPVRPNRLGDTIFGNDGISRLAKKFGFFQMAKPKETFYYWTGTKSERIFDPHWGLEPLYSPDFIGFHIHRKARTQQPVQSGCFYDWACKRLD